MYDDEVRIAARTAMSAGESLNSISNRIELADWQREIVSAHPGRFLRGLFNSDGCRIAN